MRSFLFITLLLFSLFSWAKSTEKKAFEIAKDIYSFSIDGEYISMFVVTADGVIVFETMNSVHAKAMVKAIKDITSQPIKYAFQSHNHWDHASGGQVFLNEGAMTIAHAEATAWIVANPYQDMVAPKKSWSGNRKDFELGGVKVELHYLGMNHGLGMTVFVLPQSKIAYIADIVTPNRIIFSVVPDFNLREWERSLKEILNLNFDKAIFSHNENKTPLAAGGKEEVVAQLQYLQDLRAGFYEHLRKGTNPMLIPKTLKLPKYKDWVGYDDWLEMNIWRILVDEFMGPFPWRPDNSGK
ncbi:MBL fold metallo-hydrolase [Aliikangiella coralliicola]|uniref:MBL fold metallo-hydrolase n=2 Tax=Aliikangiella coralliicola TaxID=2592383 RepID=A0A545UKA1_9GAMM|nr:MBL fold metallo-hydrolase [Aliikangiella coralliicola]